MRSMATAHASGTARRASDSPAARALARAGLVARGVLYILIGWVAILVALGQTSHQADQQGALQLLVGQPYGLVSLWLLGIGFAGYALWRLSEPPSASPARGTVRRRGLMNHSSTRITVHQPAGIGRDLTSACRLPRFRGWSWQRCRHEDRPPG
jgi:uncharacterized protein DUF1206